MFGVNPWTLIAWMGHKRISEMRRYVDVVSDHKRPLPQQTVTAGTTEIDPDRQIVAI